MQPKTSHLPESARGFGARRHAGVLTLVVCAVLMGCTSTPESGVDRQALQPRVPASAPKLSQSQPAAAPAESDARRRRQEIVLGSDRLIAAKTTAQATIEDGAPISFNFENGDIREIVRNVLGDALRESFIIDPAVQGTVSIRTAKPIKRSDLVPLLETLLRSVRAVLIRDGSYWRILPEAGSNIGATVPRTALVPSSGFGVTVLPVKHIGAKEMERVLLPFTKPSTPPAIRVDELRNLLFLSGTEKEVATLIEISEMFDIDLLAGMSFLLHTLESSDVKTVIADWERAFPAATNPFAGLLRVVPIERMNAILLISPRRDMIQTAKGWLEKLDAGQDVGGGARLYVYTLQYSQAEKLQPLLQQALTGRASSTTGQIGVAPGQTATTIGAPPSPISGQQNILPGNTVNQPPATQPVPARPLTAAQQAAAGAASQIGLARNASVVADKDRNALLIVATPSEYSVIESVLKRLDTPPKQVAIEVQLAEVSLRGDFQFGLQTFFQGKLDSAQNRMTSADGVGQLVAGATSGAFTYTWKKTDAIKAVLSLSEIKNHVRTLAQPTLITLDNQKASFNSGRQISVRTQSQSSTTTTGAVDSFQYINTGISLNVTPRVSGESVILEIQQEISDAQPPTAAGANPDISKSTTNTTVMVQSGDTMLIGGLFSNKSANGSEGFPVVSSIPILGGLFGNQTWKSDRTELALLITPRILGDIEETRDVVDELRRKLRGIDRLMPEISVNLLPSSADEKRANKEKLREQLPGEISRSLRVNTAP